MPRYLVYTDHILTIATASLPIKEDETWEPIPKGVESRCAALAIEKARRNRSPSLMCRLYAANTTDLLQLAIGVRESLECSILYRSDKLS